MPESFHYSAQLSTVQKNKKKTKNHLNATSEAPI